MPAQVWAMTTSELRLTLEGLAERSRREHERDVTLAWHIAALYRSKSFPALNRLLDRRTRRLSEEDLEAAEEAHADIEDEFFG